MKKSQSSQSKLYICATPIGNYDDVSIRLINTLKGVDYIAAEDTRVVKKLLNKLTIQKPIIRLDSNVEKRVSSKIMKDILDGKSIAMLSDAGTPAVNDPGTVLVKSCLESNIEVVPIPGASALTSFLSVSGISSSKFIFGSFFPKKDAERKQLMNKLSTTRLPIIFFESPVRVKNSLKWLQENSNVYYCAVAKELTKEYETIISGTLDEVIEKLEHITVKGEFCFLIEYDHKSNEPDYSDHIQELKKIGLTNKQIIYVLKKYKNLDKNKIYKELLTND